MRLAVFLSTLAVAACASTADPAEEYARYSASIRVSANDEGWRITSSAPANEVKDLNLYSGGEALALWVMVLTPPQGPSHVALAGSRARTILSSDAKATDEQGPWDRPEPAYLGTPWREADFRFIQRRTECYGEAYWCNRLQQFEVVLTPEMIKTFISDTAPNSIPVALFTRRDVDWRVPRAELLATLDAAGVTDQFR